MRVLAWLRDSVYVCERGCVSGTERERERVCVRKRVYEWNRERERERERAQRSLAKCTCHAWFSQGHPQKEEPLQMNQNAKFSPLS